MQAEDLRYRGGVLIMAEEQITRHIHENKDARPDSIEIGTAGKGGVLKVYFNLATMSEPDIRALINKGLSARQYASGGLTQ